VVSRGGFYLAREMGEMEECWHRGGGGHGCDV